MTVDTRETFAEIGVPENPFPGLRPFDFDESHLFFGRDGQSEQLISKLARTRFLAVVGTSGSGKSSLVRAGLLPSLLGGFMTSTGSNWRIAIMRPGNDPIGNLAKALNEPDVFGSEIEANAVLQTALADATLRRGSRGLVDAIRQAVLPKNESMLVVVDQFEEIFRFARVAEGEEYQNEAAAFVKLILEAAAQREIPIFVVLTMRSDYLGDCSRFWDLPEAINESQYLIPRLTRDQLRAAISGPIAVAEGGITPRLIARLLNDVGDDQDQLPVLQHLLMRVWDEWKVKQLDVEVDRENGSVPLIHLDDVKESVKGNRVETDGKVTRKHEDVHQGDAIDLCCYNAVGGMTDALSRHADESFNDLKDERSRQVAEKLFKCLTEKGPDNREIRRPITLGEICSVIGATEKEVSAVIEVFRRPGRSFLMPPVPNDLTPSSLVDISHESLIRGWERLKKWTDEEAQSARIYKRLAETAMLHDVGDEGFLKSPALQVALDWRSKNQPNAAWAHRYHPAFETAITFLDDSLVDSKEQEVADKERLERELKQARDFAEQQEKLVAVQGDAAKRRKRYLIFLAMLTIVTLASAGLAVSFQQRALNDGKGRLERETKLKKEVENALETAKSERIRADELRTIAQGKAEEIKSTLEKKEIAEKAALEAKTAAEHERDNAQRLEGEKQEQATTNGYFKSALNELSTGNDEGAIKALNNALAYFTKKSDTPSIISTHIIIGDVYRETYLKLGDDDEDNLDVQAVDEYDSAIALLKTNQGDEAKARLANTLTKAGSVWAESSTIEKRQKAAVYYEQARIVYHNLGKDDDEAARFIDIGKIHLQSLDDEIYQSAGSAFNGAVNVYKQSGDRNKIAETNFAIGEILQQKLVKEKEEDDSTEDDTPDDQPVSDAQRKAFTKISMQNDKLRTTSAGYYRAASIEYDALNNPVKSAEMLLEIGEVLSGSSRLDLKNAAAESFVGAADRYKKADDTVGQASAFVSAGDIFREAEEKELWPFADAYYRKALSVYHDAQLYKEEADLLDHIGNSYNNLKDPGRRVEAIGYYEEAASIYARIGDKTKEVTALLRATFVLEEIEGKDPEALYDRAVAVYENDLPKQVATYIRIAKWLVKSKPAKSDLYFQKTVTFAEQKGGKMGAAYALSEVGQAYRVLRKYDNAIDNLERSRSIYAELNDLYGQAMALYRLAVVHNLNKATKAQLPEVVDRSMALFVKALPVLESSGDKKNLAEARYAMGWLFERKKDYKTALENYETALELFRSIPGQGARVSITRSSIRRVQKALGEPD